MHTRNLYHLLWSRFERDFLPGYRASPVLELVCDVFMWWARLWSCVYVCVVTFAYSRCTSVSTPSTSKEVQLSAEIKNNDNIVTIVLFTGPHQGDVIPISESLWERAVLAQIDSVKNSTRQREPIDCSVQNNNAKHLFHWCAPKATPMPVW